MNYEKEYKKLKAGIEKAYLFAQTDSTKAVLEHILPELRESEDERIRKEIIDFLQLPHPQFVGERKQEKWITWLEKQGKETSWKPSKEEMDALYGLAYITSQYDEHKEEVITRLYQDLKREFFNGASYENMFPNTEDDVRRRSTIQVLEYARSLDTYNQFGKADIDKNIDWLEKQGEQMSDPRYSILDKLIEADDIYQMSVNDAMVEEAKNKTIEALSKLEISKLFGLEKQGGKKETLCDKCRKEQPSHSCQDITALGRCAIENQEEPQVYEIEDGKVITYSETGGYKVIEPKFKVGDWIVTDKNHIWLIDKDCSTTGYSYRLISQNGKVEVGDYNIVDEHSHLWTIKDAKPGDVLVCNDNPFLFSKYEKDEYGLVCCSYCGIPGNGEFTVNTNTKKYWCDCEFVCPATKEQCKLLFREMMKSGYEWDDENKGLKYIY